MFYEEGGKEGMNNTNNQSFTDISSFFLNHLWYFYMTDTNHSMDLDQLLKNMQYMSFVKSHTLSDC